MRKWLIAVGIVAGFMVLGFALQPILLPWPSSVTRAAYDRIEKGMTRAEVKRILGAPPGDNTTKPMWIGRGPSAAGHRAYWVEENDEVSSEDVWTGDEGWVQVAFDGNDLAISKEFHPIHLEPISHSDLIRWRLERLKNRWFPPK